ncbi:MAG TPA: YfhO family protein [Thermoanaerobaculia bacterium]
MRRHGIAAATIVVAALAVFGPALARNEVFTFRDHLDYFQPLRWFTTEQLREASLPLWNPYNASGEPWLANPQTAVFYPPAWLFLILPFATAYVAFLLFHALLLGFGTYLWFARRASTAASLMGAVALMLSGPVLSLLDVQNNFATFAWLPWVLLAAGCRLPVAGAVVLAMSFLAGEPFLAAIAAVCFVVVNRDVRTIVLSGLGAVGLAAVQLFPFLEMLRGSNRVAGFDPNDVLRGSMPLHDWLLVAIPPRLAPFHTTQHFIFVLYASAFLVALAIAGVVALAMRRSWMRLGACVSAIAIVAAIAGGPRWLANLPLTIFRYPSRVVPFAAFAIVALAVAGWDAIRRRSVVVDAVLIAAIAIDLLVATKQVRITAPFTTKRIPYDASIGRDRKVLQDYTEVALHGGSRGAWMSGYLNLYDHRFAALTAAPVTSQRYLELYYSALRQFAALRAMAVEWVVSASPLGPPLVRVAGAQGVSVYRFGAALPMAYVVTKANRFMPAGSLSLGASRASVHVDTKDGGTLVLTQNDAPGWRVAIDDAEAPKLVAFGAFRAVSVAPGAHEIVWTYRPPSIVLGAVVTFFTFIALVIPTRFVKHRAHEKFFRDTLKSVGNGERSAV